jgi:hypothetical protein
MICKAVAFSLSALTLLAVSCSIGASMTDAATRSAFCSPRRSPESFGRDGGLRLAAMHRSLPAGRTPTMRIVNPGPAEISFGAECTQRWSKGMWRPMHLPPEFVSGLALHFVQPDSVSQCLGPLTLRRWPAGKYRWILAIREIGPHSLGGQRYIHAVFRLRHS